MEGWAGLVSTFPFLEGVLLACSLALAFLELSGVGGGGGILYFEGVELAVIINKKKDKEGGRQRRVKEGRVRVRVRGGWGRGERGEGRGERGEGRGERGEGRGERGRTFLFEVLHDLVFDEPLLFDESLVHHVHVKHLLLSLLLFLSTRR